MNLCCPIKKTVSKVGESVLYGFAYVVSGVFYCVYTVAFKDRVRKKNL